MHLLPDLALFVEDARVAQRHLAPVRQLDGDLVHGPAHATLTARLDIADADLHALEVALPGS